MKFKVGDVVRVTTQYTAVDSDTTVGSVGVVTATQAKVKYPIDAVFFSGYTGIFSDDELEPLDNPKDTTPS